MLLMFPQGKLVLLFSSAAEGDISSGESISNVFGRLRALHLTAPPLS